MTRLINFLINLAFKYRLLVVALGLAVIALGIIAFQRLAIEAYPDFTDPMVRVITIVPGKGAEEVERLVTIPLEKELNGIPRQTNLRSISLFGLSVVSVTFQDGTQSTYARQQVLERVSQAEVPDWVKPQLDPDATPIGEIYRYTLSSRYYNPMTLKATEDWQLEKAFRQIPGVIDVTSFGGPTKHYQVNVDASRLKAYNLSIAQVFDALSRSNGTTGGSYIENNGQAYIVRGLGLLKNVADMENVVITAPADGNPIRIKDVADITVGAGVRLGQVGKNHDDDVVEGIVLMRRGENPSRVIQQLYQKLPEIQASLPQGVKLVPLYDRMELIRHTLDTIGHNVAMGIILVVAVLLLFMFNIRSALIVATVIPLSLMIAFILLDLFHIPANLLSLGAVDFGIIIDGTVIMVENIYRHLASVHHQLPLSSKLAIAIHAAKEVSGPIFFATVIIFSAFLPIFAFDGVAGKLFHPLAFTMNFALFGALFVSLSIIPVLCSFLFTKKPVSERESPVLWWFESRYKPLLYWSLRFPKTLLALTLCGLVISGILFTRIGSEFLPNLDEGNIWLRVTVLPTSVALERAVEMAKTVRERILTYPEVKNVVSQVGSPDDGTDPNNPSNIEFLVDLIPASQWRSQFHTNKELLIDSMDHNLKVIPGILTTFSQYIQDNVDEAISGAKGEVALKLYGPDLDTLEHYGDAIATILQNVPGMVDVGSDKIIGQPQYRIEINRAEANRYGVNASDINQLIEIALGGKAATEVIEGEKRFEVVVRFNHAYRSSMDALKNILLTTPAGQTIPLSQVAYITAATGATSILRSDNARLVTIKANVRGRDLGGAVLEAQGLIQQRIKLPAGYHLVWGGQFENQQHANDRLTTIIPITFFVIFGILFVWFRRVRDALLAMIPIPLAAMGGIFALFITHTYFSVSAGVGFIAAAGVSVQNGVILLSYVRQLQREGTTPVTAIIKGAETRLRPILMAGVVAILGLVPAALSNGIGAQSQKPFAIVIIGGLLSATFLSILIIPVVCHMLASMPTTRKKPSLEIILLLCLATLYGTGCQSGVKVPEVPAEAHSRSAGAIQIALTPESEKTIGLSLASVETKPFPLYVDLNGNVQAMPDFTAHVYSPVVGKVVDVPVTLGQSVRQGQILARVKSDQVGQIETDLLQQAMQNEADTHQATVQLNFSQNAYRRESELYAEKVSARADMETAQAQYLKDKAALQALELKQKALLYSSQDRLSLYGAPAGTASAVVKTRQILPYITIVSPRSGTLTARSINAGELADTAKELFTVSDLSRVWITGNVYERDIRQIHPAQPVDVTLDSLPGSHFQGRLDYIGNILDPQTRTLDLRITAENPGQHLKPNMFAHLKIQVNDQKALVVPQSALQQNGDYTFAYVMTSPHHYEERRVQAGERIGAFVRILAGLTSGEQVATGGTLALKGESLKQQDTSH